MGREQKSQSSALQWLPGRQQAQEGDVEGGGRPVEALSGREVQAAVWGGGKGGSDFRSCCDISSLQSGAASHSLLRLSRPNFLAE